MKTILKLLTLFIFSLSALHAAAFDKDIKFRTTKIHLSAQKPLTSGSNTFILDIKKDGKAPSDAKIALRAFMPAMPGMPAMQSKSEAKSLGNGKYTTNINFAMGGTWQIHIIVIPTTGKKVRVKSSVNI